MKKSNLFLVMVMALIVMSCSKDETTMSIPQESNAITFGTYVGRDAQTRASALDSVGLTTSGFGVFAYYTDGGDFTSSSTPNFMYNQKVSWNSSKWEYAPVKYWPNEAADMLTFFAYAPYSDGNDHNIGTFSLKTDEGEPTLTFTVDTTAKIQTDLLYADSTNLKNLTKQTIGGKVNFTFKHALSRIGFKVEVMSNQVNVDTTGNADNGSVTSDAINTGVTTVSVQEVELMGNFVTLNTFNFAAGTWGAATTDTTTYSLDSTNYSLDSTNFVDTVANRVTTTATKLNADDSYLMIIPKTFTTTPTADPLEIRVTYTVTTKDTALVGGSSAVQNVITSAPFAFKFVAGKAYSFNLHLGLTSVKFSASVADWTVVSPETVVNVPINTAPAP